MHRLALGAGIMVAAGFLAGCSSPSASTDAPSKPTGTQAPPVSTKYEAGELILEDATAQVPAWLSNGNIGIRVNRVGDIEENGYFVANGRQKDGEEKLIAQSSQIDKLEIDGKPLEVGLVKDYRQSLNLSTGTLSTEFSYGGKTIKRSLRISEQGDKIESVATIDGVEWKRETGSGEMAQPWQPPIKIDGPAEDQAALDSMAFYLKSAVSPTSEFSVGPMGLSSTQYNGHVFWDADVWVFPALALLEPDRAAAIPMYRLTHLETARRNYEEWLQAGRPTGTDKLGPLKSSDEVPGAKYPWESSLTGRETVPGPSKFQDHISGTVAFSVGMAAKLGLVKQTDFEDLTALVGGFYKARSVRTDRGFEIKGTMSPDEHHTGNNDLYTNLLADWTLNGGAHPAKPTYWLPKDSESFLTYDNDKLRGYKQAAAVLAVYPLQYGPAEAQASKMLDRFGGKAIQSGPAMTDSVHATIAARFGDSETAYKYWRDSWVPFTGHPFLLFSEKRNRPITYFVTGAGGSLQSVLYGFAGLRLDDKPLPNAAWKRQLKSGAWISARPNLPAAWKSLQIRIVLDGKPVTLAIDSKGVVEK